MVITFDFRGLEGPIRTFMRPRADQKRAVNKPEFESSREGEKLPVEGGTIKKVKTADKGKSGCENYEPER